MRLIAATVILAEKLFERAEEEAKERVKKYQHLGQND